MLLHYLIGDKMKEICKFKINNKIYTIYDVDKIFGKKSYVGKSNYNDRNIFIEERKF